MSLTKGLEWNILELFQGQGASTIKHEDSQEQCLLSGSPFLSLATLSVNNRNFDPVSDPE